MSDYYHVACYSCDLEFSVCTGATLYAQHDSGEWEVCPHPGEFRAILEITGRDYFQAQWSGRLRYVRDYACLGCFKEFESSAGRLFRRCSHCGSRRHTWAGQLLGKTCPKCHGGIVEQGPGLAALDPDWRTLPCPEVIQDLVELEWQKVGWLVKRYTIPPNTPSENFQKLRITVYGDKYADCVHDLLGWFVSGLSPYQNERAFAFGVLRLIQLYPPLGELLTVLENQCQFAPTVSDELRRGIRNYIIRYRPHVGIMS